MRYTPSLGPDRFAVPVLLLATVALASCFGQHMGAAAGPPQKAEFNEQSIPPGEGWQCVEYGANGETSSRCARTELRCLRLKSVALNAGATTGKCQPAERAHCFLVTHSDPDFYREHGDNLLVVESPDRNEVVGCAATNIDCADHRTRFMRGAKTSHFDAISECKPLD